MAGGIFVVGGAIVLAMSGDLPFGTLASPGAGMLPILVTALMIAFGVVLLASARRSPPIGEMDWTDLPHAVRVALVADGGWPLAWRAGRTRAISGVQMYLHCARYSVDCATFCILASALARRFAR